MVSSNEGKSSTFVEFLLLGKPFAWIYDTIFFVLSEIINLEKHILMNSPFPQRLTTARVMRGWSLQKLADNLGKPLATFLKKLLIIF